MTDFQGKEYERRKLSSKASSSTKELHVYMYIYNVHVVCIMCRKSILG